MCVPWKLHPFGNEYCTICNDDVKDGCPIMEMEHVEGEDWPKEVGPNEFDDQGKIVGVICICQ